MRRLLFGVLAALAVTLCATAPATARKPSTKPCAKVSYDTGNGYYFFRSSSIRARSVTCRVARRVAHVTPGSVTGSAAKGYRFTSNGFTCSGKSSHGHVPFSCRRGKTARVTFSWKRL
ncbi:MAG: hypothetical protein QOG68_1317 [Solirubrobacteraceae bacterium]|nr:hypothetical protein [Solirubrobacteraceae bacterium]